MTGRQGSSSLQQDNLVFKCREATESKMDNAKWKNKENALQKKRKRECVCVCVCHRAVDNK